MDLTIKGSKFRGFNSLVSYRSGQQVKIDIEDSKFADFGKLIEERDGPSLEELQQVLLWLKGTSQEELIGLRRQLLETPEPREPVARKSPLWQRWLENGADAASIASFIALLLG